MATEISTTITADNGETQTCVLKEKINNQNGRLVYRFKNQHTGVEYLLVKEGGNWRSLNTNTIPEPVFNDLCSFASTL